MNKTESADALIDTRLREPELIERELGYHLVRLTEREIEANPTAYPRCDDCVFRFGTVPNTTGQTLIDAMECMRTGDPFLCAHQPGTPVCAGWAALRKADRNAQ